MKWFSLEALFFFQIKHFHDKNDTSNKNYFPNLKYNKIYIRKLIKFNKNIDKFDKICLLHILNKKYVNCRTLLVDYQSDGRELVVRGLQVENRCYIASSLGHLCCQNFKT